MSTYKKTPDAVSCLTPEQYRVTQENGTERPFANAYWNSKEPGLYVDLVSGEPLFASADKFESEVQELRKRFVDKSREDYVVSPAYHKRIPADGVAFYMEGIWVRSLAGLT